MPAIETHGFVPIPLESDSTVLVETESFFSLDDLRSLALDHLELGLECQPGYPARLVHGVVLSNFDYYLVEYEMVSYEH